MTDPDATARQESDPLIVAPRQRTQEVQFAPGTMIAGRYRIASILGSGGMGEVYRADDVKLGQIVALKFLPARLARDPILLGRLHDEVRLGRQVAHPNVCHLYDIVDWEGAHFVSMEYVDGEDLSRLLRRIGRLASDKAVEIARGIAAGLMAAHMKGILHRDLKPANVMVDARGEARIMDFGLALAAGEDDGTISGTPAYMAPEQIEGRTATVQSDIYAFGLVMYELFTGKRAHGARSLPDRVRDLSSQITTPSELIRDIDPAVERIILRCLANDPSQRPRSTREILDALPGGDPLAAALAAGETPSPRLVAAAGAEGSLKPWQAWTMLGAFVALLGVFLAAREAQSITRYAAFDLSPELLRQRATDIVHSLGIVPAGRPIQQIYPNIEYSSWLMEQTDPERWNALRNGPGTLRLRLEYGPSPALSRLLPNNLNAPGWTTVEVDHRGRLAYLLHGPDRVFAARPVDWRALLAATGLEPQSLRPVPPRDSPAAPLTSRAAWTGNYPGDRTPIRIEAAAWQGTPVYLRVTGTWDEVRGAVERTQFGGRKLEVFALIAQFILCGVALFLAWRNLRLRRGDRQGATRVAVAVFVLTAAGSILRQISVAGIESLPTDLPYLLGDAAIAALVLFVLYIALEPIARRRWPEQLIAWARLIGGRPRDPLVGRHVLIGLIGGLMHAIVALSSQFASAGFDVRTYGPGNLGQPSLGGIGVSAGDVFLAGAATIQQCCIFMLILSLFTLILRNKKLATVALFLGTCLFFYLALGHRPETLPFLLILPLLLTFVTVRYGALAIGVLQGTFFLIFFAPYARGVQWATPPTLIPLLAAAALAIWAFLVSLGGQSPFNPSLLDE